MNVNRSSQAEYATFDQLDGRHSFQDAVPDGYVDYHVRKRPGGSVFFFNFKLAREMGLIAADHGDELTADLREKILETFSIVIINEYDILNEVSFRKKDIKPHRYMATRYLQLQHPNKQGKTSGDGRGIWNGEFKSNGLTWDVSSSGTGATCLSPAHAQTKQFFKTGDRAVGYGNGYNCVSDGLSAALLSDIFHENGIETEQTLAIISFEGGSAINVRAGKNLFRPAHFFRQSKLGDLPGLKASIDFFIERQISNGDWPAEGNTQNKKMRYEVFAKQMALTFSKITAQFESEYIFCWLDWDGDNILANGGIIDYGSIRQFGLYHWEYRYDDVDRMSTNIPEQKYKARYIVQNFAQIRDFLITGKKKNIQRFRRDSLLRQFDQNFALVLKERLLRKLGFSANQGDYLLENFSGLVKQFKQLHSYFEKTKSSKGIYKISDGVTCDAVFCMADLHRELPKRLKENATPLASEEFVSIIKSGYAKKTDLKSSSYREQAIQEIQKCYLQMAKQVSQRFHRGSLQKTFLEMIMRASVMNRADRITGDGVLHITTSLIRNQRKLSVEESYQVIERVVHHQSRPEPVAIEGQSEADKIALRNIKAIRHYRESF